MLEELPSGITGSLSFACELELGMDSTDHVRVMRVMCRRVLTKSDLQPVLGENGDKRSDESGVGAYFRNYSYN